MFVHHSLATQGKNKKQNNAIHIHTAIWNGANKWSRSKKLMCRFDFLMETSILLIYFFPPRMICVALIFWHNWFFQFNLHQQKISKRFLFPETNCAFRNYNIISILWGLSEWKADCNICNLCIHYLLLHWTTSDRCK